MKGKSRSYKNRTKKGFRGAQFAYEREKQALVAAAARFQLASVELKRVGEPVVVPITKVVSSIESLGHCKAWYQQNLAVFEKYEVVIVQRSGKYELFVCQGVPLRRVEAALVRDEVPLRSGTGR